MKPGMTPPAKSLPMLTSRIMEAMIIIIRLGGMISPRMPPAMTLPRASFLL